MPADTRSTRQAKHNGGKQKEKCYPSEEGSENASGSKGSITETLSKKDCSSSPSSTRRSGRLKNGNNQPPNPSPLRRSERASNSGKSDTSMSLADATHRSFKRKKSVNELVIEANHVDQHGKTEFNASSQGKKTLPARRYRNLFRAHTKKVKASGSANGRRVGPCTSSNSEGRRKKIPVADRDDLREEGRFGEDFAESASKSDKVVLDNVLQEAASETPNVQNNLELHPRQDISNASVEESVSKKQRVDANLPETNLFQDTCTSTIQEVCGEGKAGAHMGSCHNGAVNIGDKGLQLDAEMECEENKCIICKSTGRLLMCGGKGCRRQCHPACLDSQWKDLYPGIWHCPWCTQKKIKFGVHSVSEGIESILDVRVQNHEGDKTQKEYFAKYKGFAHAHNRWLPEQQILLEAPDLVSEFVQRENAIPWRQEWSEPHRLLQKRSLMLPKSELGVAYEWLVKWRGLDYNEISWELENAAFFEKPNALNLMNEYEKRHQKIQDKEKDSSVEFLTLPAASDTNCTDFINNLRDYWSKGQNVLIIDGQVQAAHIIYFILALRPNVSRPFLLMVPPCSISKWEAEFSYVAPSVNTVVYNGNRDARRMIRTLEFYDGPSVMFTVLLSTLDVITEDLEYLKCIRWEAVIMDECLNSEASADVKELASGSMILLSLDQINENAIDYYNILSLLDRNSDSCDFEGRQVDSDSITLLREKLSPFILCGPKSAPSRLVEYWVPVQMSNVQLELYCSSLLTNSTALCSKSDPVGLLREILISTRKCCDHPILVDGKLSSSLIQGVPPADILNVGVKASGKLYFLDTILTKIKDQGKKVVILFKTLGESGGETIGGLLDDYVRQRFGADCFERVDAGGLSSKRQSSVAKFNAEGKFIFLLETRACSPSIKLSSVDAVIIYGSDWNPLNDLKALQKMKIGSKFEVKVFRLYTMCSIEEKVLLLSKKSAVIESFLKGFGFSTSHMLLSWGASFLFKKLDEFHDSPGDPKIFPQCSFLKDVVQEILSVLQTHWTRTSTKCISSARQNDGGGYSTDISLLGELYSQSKDEDQHRLLWTKLLAGRQTTWVYLSLSSQRNRKRVQHYGETSEETNAHINDTVKRQKKNGNTNLEPCSPRVIKDVEKEPVLEVSAKNRPELSPKSACSTASAQKISAASSSDKLCAGQKDLHQMLKPDMERLFQILNLKEDVQQKAEQFLVYIIANQRVIRETDQLQAFLISVCWVAASILKEKIDHVESLSLAREHLNFNCNIDDAEFSFSKMQFPMKMFLRSEVAKLQGFSKDVAAGTEVSNLKQKLNHEGSDIGGGENKSKYINEIKKSVAKLLNRQMSEEKKHKILWNEKMAKAERNYKLECKVICSINSTDAVRIDKLKMMEAIHRKKVDELESEMSSSLNSMKAKHREEREAEEKEGIRKMNELKCWEENAKSYSSSGNGVEEENSKEHGVHVPPHNDNDAAGAENSSSAEAAADYGDISKSKSAVNDGERALEGLESAVAAEEVDVGISKNGGVSAENPKVGDANEESTAVRMEQHDEASSSTHLESLNSPPTINPSVVVPVSQEEHATETSRDIVLPSGGNTSDEAVHIHLRSELPVPVDTAVSHPVELTIPVDTAVLSHPVELTQPSCTTPAAAIQEDHNNRAPLNNRSVEASPRPAYHPPLHNSSYMPSSSRSFPPPPQEFDPLQKEYERVCGESNQVTRNHEDMVVRLKSECDKEIEELVGEIRRKYESTVREAEASFLQKKRELEKNQLKIVMNIKLAEAFRCKCIDHRTAPQRAGGGSSLTQQQVVELSRRQVSSSTLPQSQGGVPVSTLSPLAQPQPQPQPQLSIARSAAALPLPQLPEIAAEFQAWNMTDFETSQQQQNLAAPNGVVCLSDDE